MLYEERNKTVNQISECKKAHKWLYNVLYKRLNIEYTVKWCMPRTEYVRRNKTRIFWNVKLLTYPTIPIRGLLLIKTRNFNKY